MEIPGAREEGEGASWVQMYLWGGVGGAEGVRGSLCHMLLALLKLKYFIIESLSNQWRPPYLLIYRDGQILLVFCFYILRSSVVACVLVLDSAPSLPPT